MAKIELKGIVKRVLPVETVGRDGATRKQSVVLFVPAFVDSFGDKRGQDEEWQLDVINDKIDKLGLNNNLIEKKVVATVYLRSNKVMAKNGDEMYIINANLAELKLHEPNGAPVQAAPKGW